MWYPLIAIIFFVILSLYWKMFAILLYIIQIIYIICVIASDFVHMDEIMIMNCKYLVLISNFKIMKFFYKLLPHLTPSIVEFLKIFEVSIRQHYKAALIPWHHEDGVPSTKPQMLSTEAIPLLVEWIELICLLDS